MRAILGPPTHAPASGLKPQFVAVRDEFRRAGKASKRRCCRRGQCDGLEGDNVRERRTAGLESSPLAARSPATRSTTHTAGFGLLVVAAGLLPGYRRAGGVAPSRRGSRMALGRPGQRAGESTRTRT